MVTHTLNLCSAFNPSKVHIHSSKHSHCEHTPGIVGSHLCCSARGAVGGLVSCSSAPQLWFRGWRERCTFPYIYIHPHLQSLPARDSDLQPFDYKSDSLPLAHDFPTFPPVSVPPFSGADLGFLLSCLWLGICIVCVTTCWKEVCCCFSNGLNRQKIPQI